MAPTLTPEQLIMTTADRDYFLNCIKTLCIGSHSDVTRTAQTLQEMLQSLPVVSGEPVAYLAHYYIEPTIHTEADAGFDVVEPTTENAFPVFTSPQALTPITADDVSDACVRELWAIGRLTDLGHLGKSDVVVYLNTFLKHRKEA